MMNNEFNKLNMRDTEKATRSCSQIEIDNAYLLQQNEHLNKEVQFARCTINALKNITNQKDIALNETKLELEKALQHIQLLTFTINQQRRYSNMGLSVDNELSDDMSEEDELSIMDDNQQQQRRSINIMSKLTLRQPTTATLLYNDESILDY